MIDAALVIEGGAMRGVYTSGVLDVFMKNNMFFAYIVAASSGALNAANYVAKHKGRSARINLLHSKDRRFFGISQLIRSRGNYFNFDYLYHKPVNELYPYNYKALEETEQKFIITATNCITAEPIYFIRHQYDKMTEALTASSSIPLVSKIAIVDGVPCLDGAVSAPIGIHKAIEDGNKKIVVVLTRDYDFMNKDIPAYIKVLMSIVYRRYPALTKKLINMPKNVFCKMEIPGIVKKIPHYCNKKSPKL